AAGGAGAAADHHQPVATHARDGHAARTALEIHGPDRARRWRDSVADGGSGGPRGVAAWRDGRRLGRPGGRGAGVAPAGDRRAHRAPTPDGRRHALRRHQRRGRRRRARRPCRGLRTGHLLRHRARRGGRAIAPGPARTRARDAGPLTAGGDAMTLLESLSTDLRRLHDALDKSLEGLTSEQLHTVPAGHPKANTIAWNLWHYTRTE